MTREQFTTKWRELTTPPKQDHLEAPPEPVDSDTMALDPVLAAALMDPYWMVEG